MGRLTKLFRRDLKTKQNESNIRPEFIKLHLMELRLDQIKMVEPIKYRVFTFSGTVGELKKLL